MTARTLTAAVIVAALGTALAQPKPTGSGPTPREQPADPKPQLQPGEKQDVARVLAARITLEKGFEGKFSDALQMLSDRHGLPLVVTREVVEQQDDNGMRTGDLLVRVPRLNNVKVETVLKLLCEQTKTTPLVYPDHVRITLDVFAAYESGVLTTNAAAGDEPLIDQNALVRNKPLIKRGLVSASFKNRPLSEVLDEIAESTGATIALSPLLPANVKQAPVTVRFANTPVDAAVRTLCEMTECGVIEDANVLLVTTRERAAARAKEDAEKRKANDPQAPWGAGLGGGLGGPVPGGFPLQPELTAEITKLREQNEQLRRELDEIRKLLKK